MTLSPLSRRQFLATMGLALAGVACGGGNPKPSPRPPAPGSIDDLKQGTANLSLLLSADQDNALNPGPNRLAFDLATVQGGVISGGSPKLYLAQSASAKALGPFPATWYPFTGYGQTGDHSPESPLPGLYSLETSIPSTGNWLALAMIDNGGQTASGVARFPVATDKLPAAVGSRAVSTPTPVATTQEKLKEICTRTPPDDMHYISLDDALKNGKPTAVSFATPLLCESQLCGPVVDEHILAFEKIGPRKANFIHVEEFLPGPDLTPPPVSLDGRSPAFKAWGFESEPWVIVIDRDGIIRARLGPGPCAAAEIEAALAPLL